MRGSFFQVLDDIEIVADTTKFDSHQMAFQWLSDLLLYEDLRTYCLGGTLFYYTIEAAVERLRSHSRTQIVHKKSQNMSMLLITQARLWACGRGDVSTPSFGSHLNPISTRGGGADYWCPHQVLKATGAPVTPLQLAHLAMDPQIKKCTEARLFETDFLIKSVLRHLHW